MPAQHQWLYLLKLRLHAHLSDPIPHVPCGLCWRSSEEGDTKDDLQLPTYPDGFGNEIKAKFDEGLTLVRLREGERGVTAGAEPRNGFDVCVM